jgi:hypothetical protein
VHVNQEISLALYGAGGPTFDATTGLDLAADTTKSPWWQLTAPPSVSAKLSVPRLGLSSPDMRLYEHTFALQNAGGPFGSSPASSGSAPTDQTPLAGSWARSALGPPLAEVWMRFVP